MNEEKNINDQLLENYHEVMVPNYAPANFVVKKAIGSSIWDVNDKKYIDFGGGIAVNSLGHSHPELLNALEEQAKKIWHHSNYLASEPSINLAKTIVDLTFAEKVFFSNSGSEAVDTALKVAVAYHVSRGEGQRTRFISREKGYHGVNVGGTSVGGIPTNRKSFGALLSGTDHLPHTWNPKEMAFSKGQPTWGLHLAEELESILTLQDASTIAGVIIEPVVGSGGVIVPPEGYLERIREICDKHGILLIYDEVITGFGRIGHAFAAKRFNVTPDIITMAKGLTGAAIPMSATAFKTEIYDEIVNGPDAVIELFHGYTYSGHPVAAAAGLATLEVYENEGLFDNSLKMEPVFQDSLHSLKDEKYIIDIRNIGLMGAIHFGSEDGKTAVEVASKVFKFCYENNVLVRFSGEFIVLSPALIVEEEQIKLIIETIRQGIQSLN